MSALFNLDGRVALVTGGGSGIGAGITKVFIENGAAKVYITGRRIDRITDTANELNKLGKGKVIPIQNDVSTREGIEELVQTITKLESSLDILVNNAGVLINSHGEVDESKPLAEQLYQKHYLEEYSSWEKSYQINVFALYFLSFGLLPLLAKAAATGNEEGRGSIVNICSIAGYHTTRSQVASYLNSKHAAINLTQQIASRVIGTKVRVNSISPGLFVSEMSGDMLKTNPGAVESIPAQFLATPEKHMAGLILYLTSQAGAYVHGTDHVIDGGRLYTLPGGYR